MTGLLRSLSLVSDHRPFTCIIEAMSPDRLLIQMKLPTAETCMSALTGHNSIWSDRAVIVTQDNCNLITHVQSVNIVLKYKSMCACRLYWSSNSNNKEIIFVIITNNRH